MREESVTLDEEMESGESYLKIHSMVEIRPASNGPPCLCRPPTAVRQYGAPYPVGYIHVPIKCIRLRAVITPPPEE